MNRTTLASGKRNLSIVVLTQKSLWNVIPRINNAASISQKDCLKKKEKNKAAIIVRMTSMIAILNILIE